MKRKSKPAPRFAAPVPPRLEVTGFGGKGPRFDPKFDSAGSVKPARPGWQIEVTAFGPDLKAQRLRGSVELTRAASEPGGIGTYREMLTLEVERARAWQVTNVERFLAGTPIVRIGDFAGDDRTGSGNQLRPLNAKELRSFGELCGHIANRMDDMAAQKERG